MTAQPVDVIGVMDHWIAELARHGAADKTTALRGTRDAVAELIAACKARDSAGRRPGSMELIEDCTGHAHAEAARYDAVQARYFAALAACGAK